jgi:hypothetical protein
MLMLERYHRMLFLCIILDLTLECNLTEFEVDLERINRYQTGMFHSVL